MPRLRTVYICSACMAQHPKWNGQCTTCSAWNTLVEDVVGGDSRKFVRWLSMPEFMHVGSLIVDYTILDDNSIVFNAASEIRIVWNPSLNIEVVEFNILSDKNVNARRAAEEGGRRAYVPGALPELGVFPALDLRSYLLEIRPPSGGPLCAYPDKKGFGFSRNFAMVHQI